MKAQQRGSTVTETTTIPAVSVRDVDCVFGTHKAVDGASFDLHKGRFLTILGPSGSGKTTLLRMIAGFERPTRGAISINGVPVGAAPPHKRAIGMVFQRLALFPHMSAEENIAFPLIMRRFDARTIPDRVARYLDLVQLGPFARRRIHELSGGQQQRVAIARALVFEPDLLLLDEPLAALDRKLREEMQLEFRRIQHELGVTTINVTHDQREALVVSDEVIVMDKGRIQQMAPPTETYRAPANSFVAGFIGVTNLIPATLLTANGSAVRVATPAGEWPGTWQGQTVPAPGDGVTLAIRAEKLRFAPKDTALAGVDHSCSATVADLIFEGERVVYEFSLERAPNRTIRIIDANPAEHSLLARGAHVTLGFSAKDMLVFPT
jgi:putative spermidine/putrescine transport system ATP-binding protein